MPSREEVMDFTYPFYTEYTGGLYKKPNTDEKVNETNNVHLWRELSNHL